ncbi:hypothetical protein L4G92_06375 [Neisseria sp. ZJ106]|uniref:HEPN domain-containing protein n=1 Tax=Neisseria lisongii TaxID=2912188 RepID=A0ABY7RL17_9NEIS|nr:HEPN domain-containing protein [Neisseria lisongii]MCF7521672.1 hypothetical protein [Neisseria lisongii]WCL72241.1 HEPN domain-containing protein [Neisseria lisongii]
MPTIQTLNTHYLENRNAYPEPFRLRIHRSLSWLKRAEMMLADGYDELDRQLKQSRLPESAWVALENTKSDLDFGFVSLWIAFNAAYAYELESANLLHDKASFREFITTVCSLDREKQIYNLVWRVYSSDIQALLKNQFVFQPFWDFHNKKITEAVFQEKFDAALKSVNRALAAQDTDQLLMIVFDRLYTLRNQLIHGGATWHSSANRKQLQSACAFLMKLLPLFLMVMMENPNLKLWGKPFYPYVRNDQ